MATVTRLKAVVNNKNLPILTPDGELTNYYVGMYLNKIEETGYNLSVSEKTAISAFIDSAIQNGYIDYIQYMLPFIGDSAHSKAGIIPLIDNIDNYEMSEYTGEENYDTNFFEYDSITGKIKSVHNSRNTGDFIKTPVKPSHQDKGISVFFNANYITLINSINIITATEPVNELDDVAHYLRLRSNLELPMSIFTTAETFQPAFKKFYRNIDEIVANDYNVNFGCAQHIVNGEEYVYGWSDIEFTGVVNFGSYEKSGNALAWLNLPYNKYIVGRNLTTTYLKSFIFLDIHTPKSLRQQLSTDLFTLINALGR